MLRLFQEQNMHKILSTLGIFLTISVVAGCTSTIKPLQPGAEKIHVTMHTLPKQCQYVRQISAHDVNGGTQMYTSHAHLEKDQINDLKNQAAQLGANVVVITEHQTTHMKKRQALVDQHSMTGDAYTCPALALEKLAPQSTQSLSDVTAADA